MKGLPISYTVCDIAIDEDGKSVLIQLAVRFMDPKKGAPYPRWITIEKDLGCYDALKKLKTEYETNIGRVRPLNKYIKPRFKYGDITLVSMTEKERQKYIRGSKPAEYKIVPAIGITLSITDTLYYDLGIEDVFQFPGYSGESEMKSLREMTVISLVGELLNKIKENKK